MLTLSAGSPVAATVAEGLEPSWSYGASAQEDELDRFYLDCYSVVWNLLKFLFPDFIDL